MLIKIAWRCHRHPSELSPSRTATRSSGTVPPKRIPASNPSWTISTILSSTLISSSTSGYLLIKRGRCRAMMRRAPSLSTLSLSFPTGRSRMRLISSSASPISLKPVSRRRARLAPASVGETVRLVLFNNLTPRRVSRLRIVWLSAEVVIPSSMAALVKLRLFSVIRNALSSARSLRVSVVDSLEDMALNR